MWKNYSIFWKISGIKSLDFKDFCKVVNILGYKSKLTIKEIEQIREVKLNMNKNRRINSVLIEILVQW